jgi:hypothetical protein
MATAAELRVVRAADVLARPAEELPWLIQSLWGAGAVGMIGGAPKSCKSWLALEMAVAVASGRPCLGRYAVSRPGMVLVYMAEDAPVEVRARLENLADARGTDFAAIPVGLIDEPTLRIDREEDVRRLRATLARHRPRLLVLDPYVRLQRVDENNATEVSAVLATLRELSRAFELSIVLVHHTRKNGAEQAGQALRGSSDFHAWGDSNLYLRRRGPDVLLSIEHRAAPAPPPLALALVHDGGPVRLEARELPPERSLAERILERLVGHGPQKHRELRRALGVRDEHLSAALRELEASGRVARTAEGWLARDAA